MHSFNAHSSVVYPLPLKINRPIGSSSKRRDQNVSNVVEGKLIHSRYTSLWEYLNAKYLFLLTHDFTAIPNFL